MIIDVDDAVLTRLSLITHVVGGDERFHGNVIQVRRNKIWGIPVYKEFERLEIFTWKSLTLVSRDQPLSSSSIEQLCRVVAAATTFDRVYI